MSNFAKTIICIALIVGGFAAVFGLSNYLEANKPPLPDNYVDGDLAFQGTKMKGFVFGAEGLLADLYWMQALQYIGTKALNSKTKVDIENLKPLNPRLLYPYLDNATDLDPKFTAVYFYGSIVLPAVDSEQAIKFTEKGIRDNPENWLLYQHLGYIYWKLGDYEKAAEVYEQGAKIPGAAPFLTLMAGKMRSDGGSRDTSRLLYRQMYEEAKDEALKDNALRWLLKLDADDEMDEIRIALQNFKKQNNRCVSSFAEIFPQLKTVKLPNGNQFRTDKSNNLLDTTNAPYLLDKENCDVKIDYEKSRLPRVQ